MQRRRAGRGRGVHVAPRREQRAHDRRRCRPCSRGAAACSAPMRVTALTFGVRRGAARRPSRRSPRSAAQCSAVMPSPCAAFTSAPCVSSVRSAAVSPFIAAFATAGTGGPPAYPARRPDRRPQQHGRAAPPSRSARAEAANRCLAWRADMSRSIPFGSVAQALSANSPVLSPKLFMSSRPSVCSSVSIALAIGVPSGALRCRLPCELAVGVAEQEQRAAPVVVHVAVAHRRAVDDQRLVEQVPVAVRRVLQLLEEVRQQARRGSWLILVKSRIARLAAAVVRRRVERPCSMPLSGIDAVRRVAAHLEREHARHVGLRTPAPAGRTSASRARRTSRARRPARRAARAPRRCVLRASTAWMRRSISRTSSR